MLAAVLEEKETLRSIALFSELSIDELRKISSFSKIKNFKKNEIIFREDDFYLGFYILLKGTVKIFKLSPKGKESVLHIIKPLNAFADIPLFDGGNYPVNAVAVEDSIALLIPKEKFLALLKSDSEMALKMLSGFAKRLKSLINQVDNLNSSEVPIRLAKYLLNEVKSSGTEKLPEPFIKLSIPKATLAAFIGTITVTLSRTFKKLQDDKIIRVVGKKIFISDFDRLKKLVK
jgi:CRP/FNR family transcriptional regulator, dissimilatory nitrate respiration regulator